MIARLANIRINWPQHLFRSRKDVDINFWVAHGGVHGPILTGQSEYSGRIAGRLVVREVAIVLCRQGQSPIVGLISRWCGWLGCGGGGYLLTGKC
jgi:hypothetical protein